MDRTGIEERMNFTRENYRMMRERLFKVIYWKPDDMPEGVRPPLNKDVIQAAKNVVMMDLPPAGGEDAGASTSKYPRGRGADAAACTDDEDALFCQIEGH
jgi:hypothetical protein